jgi:hypothetical protein
MSESFKPLDLRKFRDIVRQESARIKLRALPGGGEIAFTLALALSAAVKKVFFEKSGLTFSNEPVLEKKQIAQFDGSMRVDAMEKFNATTVFSVIQFAADQAGLGREQYLMTLIVYLEQKFLPEFLRLMKYSYIDSDEDSEVKDGCGTFVNLIAGQYKKELANLGYKDFMISAFQSHINTTPEGVRIPQGVMEKYALSFEVEGARRLVVELVA